MQSSIRLILQSLLGSAVLYFVSVTIYGLFFHPLARFPGPKLAAFTRLYEGYYDVWKKGQYTFHIAELHKQYGPIVRISPFELHINDASYYDELYRQDGVWDKYDFSYNGFGTHKATLFTVNHHLHKARRQSLNPLFSKAKVAQQADMVQGHVDRLCDRISQFAQSGETFNLGAATTAFSRDTGNTFIFDRHDNALGKKDFDEDQLHYAQSLGEMWRANKFIVWYGTTLQLTKIVPSYTGTAKKRFAFIWKANLETAKDLMAKDKMGAGDERTVVNAILDSKLPESEKSLSRIFDECWTVASAAFETTANAIRLVLVNIYKDKAILEKLRAELAGTERGETGTLALRTLEQLPYLTSVLMEALRLNPGVATRLARVAPDRDLFYNNNRIPAGTPVSMTTLLLHTDEAMYPSPMRFNPDRWMDPSPWQHGDKLFAPFPRGTRSCIGMHLAWADLYLFVSTIVQRFDFDLPSARVEDFLCSKDAYAVSVPSEGKLMATATERT